MFQFFYTVDRNITGEEPSEVPIDWFESDQYIKRTDGNNNSTNESLLAFYFDASVVLKNDTNKFLKLRFKKANEDGRLSNVLREKTVYQEGLIARNLVYVWNITGGKLSLNDDTPIQTGAKNPT